MFCDKRGKLFFPVKNNNFPVKETLVSVNHKDVFRGIHLEQFSKLVSCIQGKILDIIINFNPGDVDYLVPKYYTLDSTTDTNQIVVPANHGHAFLALEENSIVLYHYSDVYDVNKTQSYHYIEYPFTHK